MIYYDEFTLRFQGTNDVGDAIPGEFIDFTHPVEVWPVSSAETDKSALTEFGIPVTVYRFATPYDLELRDATIPPEWTAVRTKWTVRYRGKDLVTPAGFERHQVSGRFDHYEFIAEDYNSTTL